MTEHSLYGIASIDAHTNALTDIFAATAHIPPIQTQIEASAREVALAIECGFLSAERVAEIRDALKFADRWNREQQEWNQT
jgi:hypothetical protein